MMFFVFVLSVVFTAVQFDDAYAQSGVVSVKPIVIENGNNFFAAETQKDAIEDDKIKKFYLGSEFRL